MDGEVPATTKDGEGRGSGTTSREKLDTLIPVVKKKKKGKKDKRSTSCSTNFSGGTPTHPEVGGEASFHFSICGLLRVSHRCEYSQSRSGGTKSSFRQ